MVFASEMRDENGEQIWGYFEIQAAGPVIVLHAGLKGAMLLEVFCHEVTHAVADLMGAGLDERQVQAIGLGLAQAFTAMLPLEHPVMDEGEPLIGTAVEIVEEEPEELL